CAGWATADFDYW
nr:immunoglobulin heavy chain junction region [Macaca mulatta]